MCPPIGRPEKSWIINIARGLPIRTTRAHRLLSPAFRLTIFHLEHYSGRIAGVMPFSFPGLCFTYCTCVKNNVSLEIEKASGETVDCWAVWKEKLVPLWTGFWALKLSLALWWWEIIERRMIDLIECFVLWVFPEYSLSEKWFRWLA